MAYRAPRPHAVKHSEMQNRLARSIAAILFGGLVFVGVIVADFAVPPQHLPWKPLKVVDPVGLATRTKAAHAGADPAQCRAILSKAGVGFSEVPGSSAAPGCRIADSITLGAGLVPLSPARPVLTCKEALALSIWERQVVQPAAYATLGKGVARIDHYGSYSCRRIYGQATGDMSEHATADALDVAGFDMTDGSHITVLADWADAGPKGRFLHQIRDGACKVFGTTLSPDYNAAHRNHLHLDMGQTGVCG